VEDLYKTIARGGESVFKDRGSKFLGFVYLVENEEKIKSIQEKLRKDFHDARHHCYAWRMGYEGELFRANDDGEPSSSAGKPILQQIVTRDLTNVLVVVIRYFGGVLLGVGGLINAYRTAASLALDNSQIVEKFIEQNISINFNYPQTNEVMKVLDNSEARIIEQNFTEKCQLQVAVKKSRTMHLLDALILIDKTSAVITS
jgi:uncharacterized YigZ family protein